MHPTVTRRAIQGLAMALWAASLVGAAARGSAQPVAECGNQIVEPGEQCDDGNTAAGDCCSPTCQFEPSGTPCIVDPVRCITDVCTGEGICGPVGGGGGSGGSACDDTNPCTDDVCDAALGCVNTTNTAPCDDGVFCNGDDRCADGACTVHGPAPCTMECNTVCDEPTHTCYDPAGTPCTDDGRACTDDECDGAGLCGHPDVPAEQCPSGYAMLRWPASADADAVLTRAAHAGGPVCAQAVRIKRASRVDGDAIAMKTSGTAMAFGTLTTVTEDVVTGKGGIAYRSRVAVGGVIDTSGGAPEISQCLAASARAAARRDTLAALTATRSLAAIVVAVRGTYPILLADGQNVIDVPSVLVKPFGKLQLVGSANTTTVILRVSGDMRLRKSAKVEVLAGLKPEQVLFMVDGPIFVRAKAQLAGTAYSANKIFVGWDAMVNGQLVGSDNMQLRKEADLVWHPFAAW